MVLSTGINKIRTAVFISGTGSNLKSLVKFSKTNISPISINFIFSNNSKAKGLNYAKIFNWLKNNGISNKEMIKTFNCGVGFCLIIERKNLKKIDKFFSKEYKPYVIGKISEDKNKVILNGSINWLQ